MNEIHPDIVAKMSQINDWRANRQSSYNRWDFQLDKLFDDIDNGLFGESAKSGSWYQHIKTIKDNNPKPTQEQLDTYNSELNDLIIASGSI